MKTRVSLLVIILLLAKTTSFAQERTKKELREEKKLAKQKQTEAMLNAKEFVFIGKTALPSGMRSVDLTTNRNYVKFQPDLIDSDMPFFGKAYSAVGYGSDTGLKFKGKPEKFTVEKKTKNFQIDVVVKGENDNFTLSLSVGLEGNASLSITSNNRSTISYQGEVSAPEKAEEKK
jgi:hypothetical protein